jgi:hypothetical protein
MSFQGDVGGIGLADLLQSLARGREGVLSLTGRGSLRSSLGIHNGQLHFLPEHEEDAEVWRNRARQAWIRDADSRIDSLRMTEIARAQRIENLYALLDSEGVHFRFAPGPIPQKPTDSALSAGESGVARKGIRRDAVFCDPVAVEGFLLEYARLQDEMQSAGPCPFQNEHVVLVVLDRGPESEAQQRFLDQVDGYSNLLELADRLAISMRQLRLTAQNELARGALRVAQPQELLPLIQSELVQGNNARAASRLSAWCDSAWPGPMQADEVELFTNEWLAGRLQGALTLMTPRRARCFLHRLDAGSANPLTATERWQELAKHARTDAIANFHLMLCQVRSAADANVPSLRDLLALARDFQGAGKPLRAGAVLRVAAARNPETTATQLEVGLGMVSAGLAAEGGPWIVAAARALVEEGKGEKAIAHRDARRVLSRARTQSVQRSLTKKNSLVTAAVVLALSVGAVVQLRSDGDREERITQVEERMEVDPQDALRLLDEHFAADDSQEIATLRATVEERGRASAAARRQEWTDLYHDAALECSVGDPLLGLERALALPAPPVLGKSDEPWPLISDLFNGVGARLDQDLAKLGSGVEEDLEQVHGETRVANLVAELRKELEGARETPEIAAFAARLDDVAKRLEQRQEQRAQSREKRLKHESLQRQDMMLATARSHAKAGDNARALAVFEQLVETDPTGKLGLLLETEMRAVKDKNAAIEEARALARSGKHAQAKTVLAGSENPVESVLLPWRVETFPAGGRARLLDGTVRVTPFTVESAFGETVSMKLELDGHEPMQLSVKEPADQRLYFSRLCERWWKTNGRIDALPVAVGDDHVVCDRSGAIARLTKDGTLAWQHKLPSLGGIARAPVFLPHKAGSLLTVTEDGEVWLLDAASGALDGPLSMGQPVLSGPVATERGVRVLFRDGTLAEWESRLKPEILRPDSLSAGELAEMRSALESTAPGGSSAGLAVLRRGSQGGSSLASPWTSWRVDIDRSVFLVTPPNGTSPTFAVRRGGDWSFVGWEAPHTSIPHGRLWIADGLGLRSFQP